MKIVFDLDDEDLAHFRREMRKTRAAVRVADDEDIIGAAREALEKVRTVSAPGFVLDRMERLDALTLMVEDPDWRATRTERNQILSALAYFGDPEDLIPDDIPGLGFLDDAIMVELVLAELKHDIDAYDDFVAYRESVKAGTAEGDKIARKLAKRRDQLRARARRRHAKDTRTKPRWRFW